MKEPATDTPTDNAISRPSSAASVWSTMDAILSPQTDEEMQEIGGNIQGPSTSTTTPSTKGSRMN